MDNPEPKPSDLGNDVDPKTGDFAHGHDRFGNMRIVAPSDTDTEELNNVRNSLRENAANHSVEYGKPNELEKTPEEIEIIETINNATNELLQKYGMEPFDVPVDNIHILRSSSWDDKLRGQAQLIDTYQLIWIPRAKLLSVFAVNLAHEMVHLKSYYAMKKNPDSKKYSAYRSGFKTRGIVDDTERLKYFNEGMTEIISHGIFDEISHSGPLAMEQEDKESALRMAPEHFAKGKLLGARIVRLADDKYNIEAHFDDFDFLNENQGTSLLLQNLLDRNASRFRSLGELNDFLTESYFTGHMLECAKLIDGTYGRGTFRRISETRDSTEYLEIIENITGTKVGDVDGGGQTPRNDS